MIWRCGTLGDGGGGSGRLVVFIISFIIKLYLIIRVSGRVVDGGWKSGQTASATERRSHRLAAAARV